MSGYSGGGNKISARGGSLRGRVTYSSDTLYAGPVATASAGGGGTVGGLTSSSWDDPTIDTAASKTVCDSFAYNPINVNQFGELRAIPPNFSLGTTWGQEKQDKVIKIQFIKSETYIDLEIFYLEREELVRIGIDVENAKKIFASGYPEAFGEEYCKQPNDWRTH